MKPTPCRKRQHHPSRTAHDQKGNYCAGSSHEEYACVAHLGFVLHQKSQEEEQQEGTVDVTSDVTTRIMLQEIERFLQSRNLMAEVAQKRNEAKLFIYLMT